MDTLRIAEWGNSPAIRIPKALMIKLNLQKGDAFKLVESDTSQLVLQALRQTDVKKRTRKVYRLTELLNEVGDEFQQVEDWNNLSAVGKEMPL